MQRTFVGLLELGLRGKVRHDCEGRMELGISFLAKKNKYRNNTGRC
jgi:hypothetical protein